MQKRRQNKNIPRGKKIKFEPLCLKSIRGRSDIPNYMFPTDVIESDNPLLPNRKSYNEILEHIDSSPCLSLLSAGLMRMRDYEHRREQNETLSMAKSEKSPNIPITPSLSIYNDCANFKASHDAKYNAPQLSPFEIIACKEEYKILKQVEKKEIEERRLFSTPRLDEIKERLAAKGKYIL